jgi:hypothetical protein
MRPVEYWRAGFSLDALKMISWLSGLVEVLGIEYTEGIVWVYLRCLDKTETLFRSGRLQGIQISVRPVVQQDLLIVGRVLGPFSTHLDVSA